MRTGKGKIRETVVVSLDKGEDLLASLEDVIAEYEIESGVILSGYGTVDRSTLHMVTTTGFPPEEYFDKKEGPLEVISLDGIIAEGKLHAHITLSDTEQAYGGHLEPGCRILYLGEVVIGVFGNDSLLTRKENEHGIPELHIN